MHLQDLEEGVQLRGVVAHLEALVDALGGTQVPRVVHLHLHGVGEELARELLHLPAGAQEAGGRSEADQEQASGSWSVCR